MGLRGHLSARVTRRSLYQADKPELPQLTQRLLGRALARRNGSVNLPAALLSILNGGLTAAIFFYHVIRWKPIWK